MTGELGGGGGGASKSNSGLSPDGQMAMMTAYCSLRSFRTSQPANTKQDVTHVSRERDAMMGSKSLECRNDKHCLLLMCLRPAEPICPFCMRLRPGDSRTSLWQAIVLDVGIATAAELGVGNILLRFSQEIHCHRQLPTASISKGWYRLWTDSPVSSLET